MISDGSCDTEEIYFKIENSCFTMLVFLLYFDQINAALMSLWDFFQKQ